MGGYLKRADLGKLHEIFLKFATVEKNGEKYITNEDFVRKFLGLYGEKDHNKESVQLIAGIADLNKDGLISFPEFQAFEGLLCFPDALYKTVFKLFDTNGDGLVTFEEFEAVMMKTVINKKYIFDTESSLVRLYFGKDKSRKMHYQEFSQFLHDFYETHGVQAFKKCDRHGTGFISAEDFKDIMMNVKVHLLTKEVQDEIMSGFPGQPKISFPYFMAFTSLMSNMELVKRVYLNTTKGSKKKEVTKSELLHTALMMSQVTPLQVDILFTLHDTISKTNKGLVNYADLKIITPEQHYKKVKHSITEYKAVSSPEERGVLIQMLESAYRFLMGAISGAVGATAVYPIDFLKTRMQNQRKGPDGKYPYKNYLDCLQKVIRNEGTLGLYRGLGTQLIGVAPEKATKLAVHDFVRDKLTDSEGHLLAYGENISGFCAGICQVLFTNPLEIVKIRLQVAGEVKETTKVRAWAVVKDLGLKGLYKGARACMLRDSTFSSIYFPAYATAKAKLSDENGYNHPLTLLAAGAIAGIPAAYLVTPFDVIKTRLQVIPRPGQTVYHGIFDAARKIRKEEGIRAFYKGAVARVCRSSPQFGVTLLTYEILQRLFDIDFGGIRPSGSELKVATPFEDTQKKAHHIGGYQVAIPVLTGIETKFGISLPKFSYDAPK